MVWISYVSSVSSCESIPEVVLQERDNNGKENQNNPKIRSKLTESTDLNKKSTLKESFKRHSILDSANLNGGVKIMNFLKSGLKFSRFKSKPSGDGQGQRHSLYVGSQSSKSEENILAFEFEPYVSPIRISRIVLNTNDPTLYMITLTLDGDTLYEAVVLLNKECVVQPVHPSVVSGQKFCFQIIKRFIPEPINNQRSNSNSSETPQIIKSCSYNSSFRDQKSVPLSCESVNIIRCQSAIQRDEWIMRIKKHINPNIEHMVRHEDILKIWIQEAKHLIPNKKYFCEIRLNQILYGRTTIKLVNDMVFWGEEFEFTGLENVSVISVLIYKLPESKRKRDNSELVALINLPCTELVHNYFTEKWYTPTADFRASTDHLRYSHSITIKEFDSSFSISERNRKTFIDSTPMIRIKTRYRPLEVLPTLCYEPLLDYLVDCSICLVVALENHLKVKQKEEFAKSLLLILQKKDRHIIFLSDVIVMEVSKSDDSLILRGNTIASKAIECYLKMAGEEYLSAVLSDMVNEVVCNEVECEVDPLKIPNTKDHSFLIANQKRLLGLVECVWARIQNSSYLFPEDLKAVFIMIREKLRSHRRGASNSSAIIAQVISSCIFLRFICPAIMSPFLFGLSHEYSDKLCINRTFTLVAKCIQSLANFSKSFQRKEFYMSFIEDFLTNKAHQMNVFLHQISTNETQRETKLCYNSDYFIDLPKDPPLKRDMCVDIGYQLAELSNQLSFHLQEIQPTEYTNSLTRVHSILKSISMTFEIKEKSTTSTQIPFSRSIPSTLISMDNYEENFSYFPQKSSDDIITNTNFNYVNFETVNPRCYAGLCNSSGSPKIATKMLNEKEINNNWNEVVTESYHNSKVEDQNNCTVNSSGYESLNLPINIRNDLDMIRFLQVLPCVSADQRTEDLAEKTIQQINSPKFSHGRQSNMYRRIKRSPKVIRPLQHFQPLNKFEDTKFDKSGSFEDMPCSENAENFVTRGIGCIDSLCNMTESQHSHQDTYNRIDFSLSDNESDSSIKQLIQRSLESSHCNSFFTNVDLDPLVFNELERLQLFFEYYRIERPLVYVGNAIELYAFKTHDEDTLQRLMTMKERLKHKDIADHITASYRLLKHFNHPGKMSSDSVIKNIIAINQNIQSLMKAECDANYSVKSLEKGSFSKEIYKCAFSTQSLSTTLSLHSLPYQEDNKSYPSIPRIATSPMCLTFFDQC